MQLKGKVALITGGSAGIGFGTAKRFLEEGATVYITGRRVEKLQEAVDRLGNGAHYIVADVGSKAEMNHVAEAIAKEQGRLDVVFCNAGIGHYIKFEDITENDIDRVFNTNFKGTIFTIQCVLPILAEGASIILNTSMTEDIGLPDFCIYAAAKSAVKSLIYSLTTDFRDKKIRVNAVAPGVVPTEAASGELGRTAEEEAEKQKQRASIAPLGRLGTVEDIAAAVTFLASDEASYITGSELTVDGGMTRVFAGRL